MARYNAGYDTTGQARVARPRVQVSQPPMPTPAQPTPGFRRPPAYPTLPQAQYGQPAYQTPTFPGFRPTQEFAQDPTTANFESLMNYQIPYYMQPVQQRDYLGETAPQYGQLLETIQALLGQAAGPSAGESGLMRAFGALMDGGNADRYAAEYRQQLAVDPYSGAEGEAYQTEFMDPLASQRDQALARTLREVSDQGIDPSSGIAQAKMALTRSEYDKAAAAAQNTMAINRNQQRMQRQGQAFQAGLSAEELKQRGASSAASAAGGAANAWNNRMGLMADLAGMGNTAAMQRASMGYGVDAKLRDEQYQNFQTAMTLAQIMSQLPAQRQQEALQLMSGNDPANMLQGTNMVAGQRVNQANSANAAYANTWGGLGSMLGYLQQMFPTAGGGAGYADPGFTTNTLPFDLFGGAGNGGAYYPGG